MIQLQHHHPCFNHRALFCRKMHRKLLNLLPLLCRSDRSHEDAGIDTRLEPAGRHVDPIFSTAHVISFLAGLVIWRKPVQFAIRERAVAHVGLLFVVNKAGSSPTHGPAVSGTPSGPMLSLRHRKYRSIRRWSELTCWLCGCQERRPPTAQSPLVARTSHCSQRLLLEESSTKTVWHLMH